MNKQGRRLKGLGLMAISMFSSSIIAAPFNGFYVGAQVGYGHANHEVSDNIDGLPLGLKLDLGAEGEMAGIILGWGTLINPNLYAGIEAQYSRLDGMDGTLSIFGGGLVDVDWGTQAQWSLSARLGYLPSSDTMFFTRLGYVEKNADIEIGTFLGEISTSIDDVNGVELGLGVEHHLGSNFSVRGEYVYTRYDDADLSFFGADVAEVESTSSSGRVSLNYTF